MRRIRPRLRDRALARRYRVQDDALSAVIARDGYVVVRLLDDAELTLVRSIRQRSGPAPGDPSAGLFNDSWSTDVEYKRAISAELSAVLGPALRRQLPDHRPLGFAHIVKWSGAGGAVVAHRDPTFVDEGRFRSIMMWCPLEDVRDADGALWVVPGSHRRPTALRVHQAPENVVEDVTPTVGGRARVLEMRAGEAVLYDHSLVHLSGPNHGPTERVAIACPLVPNDAQARYAVTSAGGAPHVVQIDESFFIEHRLCDLDIPRVLADYPPVDGRAQPASHV